VRILQSIKTLKNTATEALYVEKIMKCVVLIIMGNILNVILVYTVVLMIPNVMIVVLIPIVLLVHLFVIIMNVFNV